MKPARVSAPHRVRDLLTAAVPALAEPALMLGLFTVALWGGSLNLGALVRTTAERGLSAHPSDLLAEGAAPKASRKRLSASSGASKIESFSRRFAPISGARTIQSRTGWPSS